ncbi:MAG: hypothetical protein JWM86_982, partial [Thermoleophilia bacterium]|nr:hypothetical protein [Thermoleophilia bacterium]
MPRHHLSVVGPDTPDTTCDTDLIREFLAQTDVADSTRVRYRAQLNEFRTWLSHPRTRRAAGGTTLLDVRRADVARFMSYLLSGDRYAVAPHALRVALPSASTRKSFLASLHKF